MIYDNGESYDQQSSGAYYDLCHGMIDHYLSIYLPQNGMVLDAGGGTGKFSIRAAKLRKKLHITNFDLSQPMLDTSVKKTELLGLQSRISIRQGDMHHMPFPDCRFNFVMCFGDALSFCENVEQAFSELVRVTEPGGLIHLSVNSFWGNFYEMLARGHEQGITAEDIRAYQKTHVLQISGESTGCRSFTMNHLKKLAEENNLEIEKVFAAPVLPVPEGWLDDPEKTKEITELQFRYCEDANILEFGNHLNVIFRKLEGVTEE